MKKLKVLILTLLLCFPCFLYPQFYDDFSDGDFFADPIWSGDTSNFCVDAQHQLQLNGHGSGTASLVSQNILSTNELEWRISVKMTFAPSDNNYACIFLCASDPDLLSPTSKSYYLKLGESGSADVIELFYHENGQTYSLFRGTTSVAAPFDYNIKVTKDVHNLWRLYVDEFRQGVYKEENSAFGYCDISDYQYIGIRCQYTSTNANRFFFDDIYCGPPCVDSIAPQLSTALAQNDGTMVLEFNKAMDTSVCVVQNYLLEGVRHPQFCEWTASAARRVVLHFDTVFEERTPFILALKNLRSWNGVDMHDTICQFFCYTIQGNEIIISEVMAMPQPVVQLPECEYVELYNRLSFEVVLQNWSLMTGNTSRVLPKMHIPPRAMVCIVPENYRALFAEDANIVTVSSLGIADDEQVLSLCDENGKPVYALHSFRKWHTHDLKRQGGWSLEIIDVDNPCAGKENWASSTDDRGGTPAEGNSVAADNKDVAPPRLDRVTTTDASHINVFFDEPMSELKTEIGNLFDIDRQIVIDSGRLKVSDAHCVEITVHPPLEYRMVYTLTLNGSICDCVGNEAETGQFATFSLPEVAEPHDVILNEILFNPPGSTDAAYIELYNHSEHVVDLGELYIGLGNGDVPKSVVPVVEQGFQLMPKQYVAVCKDKGLTREQYFIEDEKRLVENIRLPSFPNSAGTVHLMNKSYTCIDRFSYDEHMHYSLLSSVDGVSLERLHFEAPTQSADNWKSASAGAGWGTPGYVNSQASELAAPENAVSVIPELFSPDNDGVNDYVEIYCHFVDNENRVTVTIYNSNGQKIKVLANNQPCGLQQRFVWDGMADNGSTAMNDIYIVCVDWWNQQGCRQNIRKCVTLVRRL